MAINVEITKSGTENNLSILRKFTKKVQGSGVLKRLRSKRYSERALSPYVRKKKTLKRLAAMEKMNELIKMGKAPIKQSSSR